MSDNPLFGRKWKISVLLDSDKILVLSDSTKEGATGALRCTFRIEKHAIQVPVYSEITVYNLTGETESTIIKQGMQVIVEAGYEKGQYGPIFNGQIFQPIRVRENFVDYKLTLHCIDGYEKLSNNLINQTIGANSSAADRLKILSEKSDVPIPLSYVIRDLKLDRLPRGKTFFGEPKRYFSQIADDNNAAWYMIDGKMAVSRITDVSADEALVITPTTGLVGTPQQIQDGMAFRCLLNPSITISPDKPLMHVKIDQSQVRIQKVQIRQLQTQLDQNMVCKVIGVTYIGDTRGNDWYCDVIGVNGEAGLLPMFLQDARISGYR